jgi:hypothetical protein
VTKKERLDVSFCVVRDNLGVGGEEWKRKVVGHGHIPAFGGAYPSGGNPQPLCHVLHKWAFTRQAPCLAFQICQQHRSARTLRTLAMPHT